MSGKAAPLLSVHGLEMRFGGLVAVDDVSFDAMEGVVTAVIGPNGAGKTTLFNCITGMYRPTSGTVALRDRDITGFKPHQIARQGIARTFQNLALFSGLSVIENLMIGGYGQGRSGLIEGAFLVGRAGREQRAVERKAGEILDFLGIGELADAMPSELPYGRQKQVEFGRVLMQDARLVLLDEPMAGMSRTEKTQMIGLIRSVRDRYGVSFLVVEHDMPVIMEISDHIVVLDFGRKIAEGTPGEVQANPAVIEAYLGAEDESGLIELPQPA